jgi:hypothetical protein
MILTCFFQVKYSRQSCKHFKIPTARTRHSRLKTEQDKAETNLAMPEQSERSRNKPEYAEKDRRIRTFPDLKMQANPRITLARQALPLNTYGGVQHARSPDHAPLRPEPLLA